MVRLIIFAEFELVLYACKLFCMALVYRMVRWRLPIGHLVVCHTSWCIGNKPENYFFGVFLGAEWRVFCVYRRVRSEWVAFQPLQCARDGLFRHKLGTAALIFGINRFYSWNRKHVFDVKVSEHYLGKLV